MKLAHSAYYYRGRRRRGDLGYVADYFSLPRASALPLPTRRGSTGVRTHAINQKAVSGVMRRMASSCGLSGACCDHACDRDSPQREDQGMKSRRYSEQPQMLPYSQHVFSRTLLGCPSLFLQGLHYSFEIKSIQRSNTEYGEAPKFGQPPYSAWMAVKPLC